MWAGEWFGAWFGSWFGAEADEGPGPTPEPVPERQPSVAGPPRKLRIDARAEGVRFYLLLSLQAGAVRATRFEPGKASAGVSVTGARLKMGLARPAHCVAIGRPAQPMSEDERMVHEAEFEEDFA